MRHTSVTNTREGYHVEYTVVMVAVQGVTGGQREEIQAGQRFLEDMNRTEEDYKRTGGAFPRCPNRYCTYARDVVKWLE